MKCRPKNKIKTKLKVLGSGGVENIPGAAVAVQLAVHRSSVYRWRKKKAALEADKGNGNKFYVDPKAHQAQRVRHPDLEQRLLDHVAEMRKNRKLCVTTKCLILMMAKFDPAFVRARQITALRSWTARFLKRNRLVVRRVTHKGSKTRSDTQGVADSFVNSINAAVEMDGILSFYSTYEDKYAGLFSMDQTAVFVGNPGKLTIDYRGTRNVDIVQGTAENGGRCSVFLCASTTGQKLRPFIVFAGVPGCRVADEVTSPSFGCSLVEHTVQAKAWCDHSIMKEWISKIWCPSVNGCRMLLLDSLKVHKMASIYKTLEEECTTQVQYIPPGVTELCQPMDVSVMRSFKKKIENLYVQYHVEHPFPMQQSAV